jgi:uncharacterized radical SAM superfamily Fe-S cluster-containing enzyme
MVKLLYYKIKKKRNLKMHLEVTPEVLISQLGYSRNEQTQKQAEAIIANTKGFEKFAKHIISLNDALKHMNAFVALSNSENYLKIKCGNADATEILKEFHTTVKHFSDKYNVDIKKLENKEVYYIIGIK